MTTTVWFQAVRGPCCLLLHSPSPAEAAPAMTLLTVLMGYRMPWPLKSAAHLSLVNLRQARLRLCISVSALQEAHARHPVVKGVALLSIAPRVGDVFIEDIESIKLVTHVAWWVHNMIVEKVKQWKH